MSEELTTKVRITLEKDMIFKCDLGEIKVKDCYIDDTHKDEVNMLGPNPSRMLAMAVSSCLSASFIFCLKKRNFNLDNLKAEGEITVARNEKGFWRVKKIDVAIKVKIDDPEARKRAEQCLKKAANSKSFFENFCIVTESVRSGIEVNVDLDF
ncbi:MAG: OsmC family protein [Promethearchaeota archaeon]